MLLEISHFLFETFLFLDHIAVGLAVVHNGLVLHVGGHVDFSLVLICGEIVCHRHLRCVVDIGDHYHLLADVWLDIFELHPEHRIFLDEVDILVSLLERHRLIGELIACPVEHRTERHDAGVESGGVLVIVRTLLHEIAEHLRSRHIGIRHIDGSPC